MACVPMVIRHQHFDLQGHVILERMVFRPPLKADRSMHNEACFFYNVRGRARVYGALQRAEVGAEEGVVMKCGNYLASYYPVEGAAPAEAIAVHFYPEVLRWVYRDGLPTFLTDRKPGTRSVAAIEPVRVGRLLRHYTEGLRLYFEAPDLVDDSLIVLKVRELIALLVRSESSDSGRVLGILQSLFDPEQATFREIIQANLYENLSLQDLAILTNHSLSSFKRKFRRVFGQAPGGYLREQKLGRAAELLRATRRRVTDIAYTCGFADPAGFSRQFAKRYGSSPSQYRDRFPA